MKKLISVTLTTTLTAYLLATPVIAQTNLINRLTNTVNRSENQATKAAARQETNLTNLQKRADQMVAIRITSLNNLSNKIQNDQRLSSSDKSSLNGDIQTAISGLNTLKTKIDSDTDLATARADTKEIVTNFRVYLVVMPKTQLLIVIGNLQTTTANLQALTPKIQNLINTLKSDGKDVTSLQSLLADINSRLTNISNQLATDKSKVTATTVTDVNDAHNTFVSVRQDLSSVRSNLAQIRNDLAQMRGDFRNTIKTGTQSATSSSTTP